MAGLRHKASITSLVHLPDRYSPHTATVIADQTSNQLRGVVVAIILTYCPDHTGPDVHTARKRDFFEGCGEHLAMNQPNWPDMVKSLAQAHPVPARMVMQFGGSRHERESSLIGLQKQHIRKLEPNSYNEYRHDSILGLLSQDCNSSGIVNVGNCPRFMVSKAPQYFECLSRAQTF